MSFIKTKCDVIEFWSMRDKCIGHLKQKRKEWRPRSISCHSCSSNWIYFSEKRIQLGIQKGIEKSSRLWEGLDWHVLQLTSIYKSFCCFIERKLHVNSESNDNRTKSFHLYKLKKSKWRQITLEIWMIADIVAVAIHLENFII